MKSLILRFLFPCTALLVALAGCSTSSSVVTGETRAPISPEEVKIHRTEPDSFEEIGIVEATSKGAMAMTEQAKMDAVMERLKAEAAELGANGVLILEIADGHGGGLSIGVGTGSYGRSSGVGVGASTSTARTYKMATGVAIYVSE